MRSGTSRGIDPALMLSLLPDDTLHILDETSARSIWLEPWRELARTVAFKAEHVFVSRRLVRVLKGNGRIAVYFPDNVEPGAKAFRLFRAVARISMQADARIVPVFVGGATPPAVVPDAASRTAPRHWFQRLDHRRAGADDDRRTGRAQRRRGHHHRRQRAVRPHGRGPAGGRRPEAQPVRAPSATPPTGSVRRASSSRT